MSSLNIMFKFMALSWTRQLHCKFSPTALFCWFWNPWSSVPPGHHYLCSLCSQDSSPCSVSILPLLPISKTMLLPNTSTELSSKPRLKLLRIFEKSTSRFTGTERSHTRISYWTSANMMGTGELCEDFDMIRKAKIRIEKPTDISYEWWYFKIWH